MQLFWEFLDFQFVIYSPTNIDPARVPPLLEENGLIATTQLQFVSEVQLAIHLGGGFMSTNV